MIKERDGSELEIRFFDSEGNWLAEGEKIQDWTGFPVVMKMREGDNVSTYAINFNTNFRLDHQSQVAETLSFSDIKALSSEENFLLFA